MSAPAANSVRFVVEPRDVPKAKIARRLHLTVEQFDAQESELITRGFPTPDITTGMYDLDAVGRWMDLRHGKPANDNGRIGAAEWRKRLDAI